MKKLIFLIFLAVFLAASRQVTAQEGSVGGIVPPPSKVEEIEVQTSQVQPPPAPEPQIIPPRPSVTVTPPKTTKKLPRYQTRSGVEEAARRVLRGDFALRNGHTTTPPTVIKCDHKSCVIAIGNLSKKHHRALWTEAHKAGIVSRSFVEARDAQTLSFAADYTDHKVARASRGAWLALVLSIIAIIIGLAAMWRRPRWRPVFY